MKKKIKIPHIFVILVCIAILFAVLSWIIPAGAYDRVTDPNSGRTVIDPNSFHYLEKTPITFIQFISSYSAGFMNAASMIFMTLVVGGTFGIINELDIIPAALAAGLKKQGFSVLTIDCDPQGNLSMSVAAENQDSSTMYEVMKGTVSAREAIQHTSSCDIIPANTILAGIEQELHNVGKEMTLREKLRDEQTGVAEEYDYILIDCPPSLGLLTVNALTAADYLLIPTMAETFAASGITQLYDTFRSVKKYTNPALRIDGVLLTRTERTRVTKTIQELTGKIAEYMGADVYRTTIRSNVIIKEAQAAQENVFDYVEGKSQTKGERVTESSRNFVGDCLAFVKEFVEKEREQ